MSRWLQVGFGLLLFASPGEAVRADCPALPEINSRLAALPLNEASRTRRFALPVPESLYAKAISKPGTPYPSRDGKLVQGVMLSPLPIESWWKAINDDDHHDEKGYLPLRHSEVIKGIPGRGGRETFQYYSSFGIGRWWVNRLEMNEDSATRLKMWKPPGLCLGLQPRSRDTQSRGSEVQSDKRSCG